MYLATLPAPGLESNLQEVEMNPRPIPPIEPVVPHGPHLSHPLQPLMTCERVLGALLWCVWHHELPAELIHLVDALPNEYRSYLAETEQDLDTLLAMTWGCNMDTRWRDKVISVLRSEIECTQRVQGYSFEGMMKPERVLGALLWKVWKGQLPAELLEMVRALPDGEDLTGFGNLSGLGSDLETLLKMALASRPPKTKKGRRQLARRLREQVARLLEQG
jgi:hypothetical protein